MTLQDFTESICFLKKWSMYNAVWTHSHVGWMSQGDVPSDSNHASEKNTLGINLDSTYRAVGHISCGIVHIYIAKN